MPYVRPISGRGQYLEPVAHAIEEGTGSVHQSQPQANPLSVSVVICAYTLDRWFFLCDAINSVQAQTSPALEIILVVDHNDELLVQARRELHAADVRANWHTPGLSGARNCGVLAAKGDVVAFLDDDAVASQDWLGTLVRWYNDRRVLGVGGRVEPRWVEGRPSWFPEEFDWIVGCTFKGMPLSSTRVASLVGCNLSFRREIFGTVGEFNVEMGRVGTAPLGCEETEFCMRGSRAFPQNYWIYDPQAGVGHRVPGPRATFNYFRRRSFAEGLSKAAITSTLGTDQGLQREREYTRRTLPLGIATGMGQAIQGRTVWPALRAGAIVTGFAFTALGYVWGKTASRSGCQRFAPARETG
jgi:hypothetical protein